MSKYLFKNLLWLPINKIRSNSSMWHFKAFQNMQPICTLNHIIYHSFPFVSMTVSHIYVTQNYFLSSHINPIAIQYPAYWLPTMAKSLDWPTGHSNLPPSYSLPSILFPLWYPVSLHPYNIDSIIHLLYYSFTHSFFSSKT